MRKGFSLVTAEVEKRSEAKVRPLDSPKPDWCPHKRDDAQEEERAAAADGSDRGRQGWPPTAEAKRKAGDTLPGPSAEGAAPRTPWLPTAEPRGP